MARDGLAIRSCIPLQLKAMCQKGKILPTPHKIHSNSQLCAESSGMCPPALLLPSYAHPSFPSPFPLCILPALLPTSSHCHTPTSLPVSHLTFWVDFPPIHRKDKGKQGGKAPWAWRGHPQPRVPPPASPGSCYRRSKSAAKIVEGEELVALTSGGQKQLLLWSRQEVKEEGEKQVYSRLFFL